MSNQPHVVVVGGGLAGLAAAVALARNRLRVTLLEARPRWGGRASSFVDAATGETIDNCQHVTLGCCTAFARFCRTIGIEQYFSREACLHFVGPDGRESTLLAWPLPAPMHLAPAFARLKFLSWRDKLKLARGLWRLKRSQPPYGQESFLQWLTRHQQPAHVIERFWQVVLVSALSESLDRIDVGHARKVFVDAFLASRHGWEVWLPSVPLDRLYGQPLQEWFRKQTVDARLQCGARRLLIEPSVEGGRQAVQASSGGMRIAGVELRTGETIVADYVVLAVPAHQVEGLVGPEWRAHPYFAAIGRLETAPITSVHLWFDRPIFGWRHAALIGRQCQWVFNRTAIQNNSGAQPPGSPAGGGPAKGAAGLASDAHYYQVVISASREAAERPSQKTLDAVIDELRGLWPAAAQAGLLHARVVTEHKAVISMTPGVDALRPVQQSPVVNLQLAGDYTQTGWPCTMEGAVRSGELAAANVFLQLERSR
jgi:squalene-associated FAD-dependent desaturase